MNDIQTESVFVSNEILEKTKRDISLYLFNQYAACQIGYIFGI